MSVTQLPKSLREQGSLRDDGDGLGGGGVEQRPENETRGFRGGVQWYTRVGLKTNG